MANNTAQKIIKKIELYGKSHATYKSYAIFITHKSQATHKKK